MNRAAADRTAGKSTTATTFFLAPVSRKLWNSASINSASDRPPNGGKAFACTIGGGTKPLFGTTHVRDTRYIRHCSRRGRPIIIPPGAALVKYKLTPARASVVPALAPANRPSDPICKYPKLHRGKCGAAAEPVSAEKGNFRAQANNHYSYRDYWPFGKFPCYFVASLPVFAVGFCRNHNSLTKPALNTKNIEGGRKCRCHTLNSNMAAGAATAVAKPGGLMAKCSYMGKVAGASGAVAFAVLFLVLVVFLPLISVALQCCSFQANAATVQTEKANRPVASSVRLDQSTDRATLTFELSEPVQATAFVLADPDRVIVDLPQTDFAVDPEIGKPANLERRKTSLVASFRYGQLEPGKSRIVIDLAAQVLISRVGCEKNREGDTGAWLVIELAKADKASFQSAVQSARARLAEVAQAKKTIVPEPASPLPVIVLDPGHGGIDRGARVRGLVEKDIVLEFAKALAAKLEAIGRFKIVLTREEDNFVSLSERVRMGRDHNAALFISIHADTLSKAADVSGATVYTLSDRASDAEAARVAEKENQSDIVAGLDLSDDNSDVSGILFDLTRRETRAYSHMFAHTLVNYWRAAGRLNKNPRRSASFLVLKAPDVPSVLLELGYLSNGADSHALNSPQWRDHASGQVVEAIEAFFASRERNAPMTKTDPDLVPSGKVPASEKH